MFFCLYYILDKDEMFEISYIILMEENDDQRKSERFTETI